MNWFEFKENGALLRLLIQPKASVTEVIGLHGEPPRLKIRVAAAPHDDAANQELINFLKKHLRIPARSIEIQRGLKSRQKDVFCQGIDHSTVTDFAKLRG